MRILRNLEHRVITCDNVGATNKSKIQVCKKVILVPKHSKNKGNQTWAEFFCKVLSCISNPLESTQASSPQGNLLTSRLTVTFLYVPQHPTHTCIIAHTLLNLMFICFQVSMSSLRIRTISSGSSALSGSPNKLNKYFMNKLRSWFLCLFLPSSCMA